MLAAGLLCRQCLLSLKPGQSDYPQQSCQIGLDPGSAVNGLQIQAGCELQAGHGLGIGLPVSLENSKRVTCASWVPVCSMGEVSEKECLMTRALPDKFNSLLMSETDGSLTSIPSELELVRIEQNETSTKYPALESKLPQTQLGPFNAGERVTNPGREGFDVDMDRQVRIISESAKEADVSGFGVTLARDEDRHTLGNVGRASAHPMFGTAPNAPLRYLR